MPNLYESLASSPDTEIFKTLIDMVDASPANAGFQALLSDPAANATLFIPTDAAFVAAAQTLGFTGTDEAGAVAYLVSATTLLGHGNPWPILQGLLSYHIGIGIISTAEFLTDAPFDTQSGETIGSDGLVLMDNDADTADASVVVGNTPLTNGIAHTIDTVMLPVEILPSNGVDDVRFVIGTGDSENIVTGADDDWVQANGGSDTVVLNEGDDVAEGGTGNDTIYGGDGNDSIDGGTGNDLIFGGEDRDTIYGGSGDDTVNGGDGADTIFGGNDNDDIIGEDGADEIHGGNGHDDINGGTGEDTIFGGAGNDTLYGDSGSDTIFGGQGNDTMDGGSAADTFVFANGSGHDTIDGFASEDRIDVSAFGIWNLLMMDPEQIGDDVILRFDNNDHVILRDVLVADLDPAQFVFATEPPAQDGTASADILIGDNDANVFYGGNGSDFVSGKDGADVIFGGSGEDELHGGLGRDSIEGGSGRDQIYGGNGRDVLIGGSSNDRLYGGNGRDQLFGGNDNDRLFGGNNEDLLVGDNGNDQLWGDNGNDLLFGGVGRDKLYGGDGEDILTGGRGQDMLYGGAGADTFVFIDDATSATDNDIVMDFEDGIDLLDISSFGFSDISQFASITDDGFHTTIDLGTGDIIELENTLASEITNADFIFSFSDVVT